jgi:hypothetical protein
VDVIRQKLSTDLVQIYDWALQEDNVVLRVDEPAGTACPLAVVFTKPIIRADVEAALALSASVFWHESADQHYEVNGMAGFASRASHQFVYGPKQ